MDAVRALVARSGGTGEVRVERVSAGAAAAVAEYECSDGVLVLRGSDPVAAASAYAQYLKAHGGRQLTWDQPRLEPALASWPQAPRTRLTTGFQIRYYLNLVTYGYSTAFWDWDRWDREVDWMALHAITHPLMQVGHEAVLARLFQRAGLSASDVGSWIGGAAHFPWTWVGGMNSFGGPLPSSWIDRHIELAQRILDRQRSFGMTPVLPMFGGHVPPQLADASAGEIEWQGWRTPILHPGGERFQQLATEFLAIQRELFGTDHHYAVDPFIESLPPTGDAGYLASAGSALYHAMATADPEATWVLQGWPFHYHRDFWTAERVRAYLSGVPDERLILLDLWGEHAPMWRDTGMYGRRWVWSVIHNFGGRFALFGDLNGARRDVDELRRARPHRLEGVGLAPEAIENNTVFYELATDLTWGTPTVPEWLRSFARQRYGLARGEGETGREGGAGREGGTGGGGAGGGGAVEAWQLLAGTLYAPGRTRSIPSPVIARPWSADLPFAGQRLAGEALPTTGNPQPGNPDEPQRQSANIDAENDPVVLDSLPLIARAARLLIGCAGQAAVRDPLERDVAELVGHVLAQGSRVHIRAMVRAFRDRDADGILAHLARFRRDLLDLDELAGTRAESSVGGWIAAARAWAGTPDEADAMERDARSLVSVWGHQSSGLHDYSGRHWAGLIRDYYLPRWQLWARWLAQAVTTADTPDVAMLRSQIVAHEEAWRGSTGDYSAPAGTDTLAVASRILDRLGY